MRGGGAALLLCWLCVAGGEQPELVFRVPDVSVHHEPAPDRAVGTGHSRSHQQVDGRKSAGRREVHGQQQRTSSKLEQVSGGRDERENFRYEEYFVEHEISAVDAKEAAKTLRVQNIPERAPGCGVCSREEMVYCEHQVITDHCCCERRFQEPYPWIPHTCYAGPQTCKPIAKDCGFYRRLRDCCCDRRLAEKWKNILSSSPARALPGSMALLVTVLVYLGV